MHRLRLVWQLHLDAFQLLRSRLRAFRERGPWTLLIIGLLFLSTLAVPFFWGLNGRGLEYLAPWAIYLAAHIAVVLRHPFKPRKAVIHPLPVWYFWGVQALCAAGAVLLSWLSVLEPGKDAADRLLDYQPVGLFLVLVALTLVTTALPPLVAYLAALAERLELYRWFRLAPNLYSLALGLGVGAWLIITNPLSWDYTLQGRILKLGMLLLIPGIPAVLLRRKLWSRDSGALLAVLPQCGLWSSLVAVPLVETEVLYSPTSQPSYLLYISIAVEYAATLYWMVLLLRVSPVESIDRPSVEDEALSVQTDPTRYVETSGHGTQLLAFIRRSDGGVLGLTGVRGAGKSALIAHILNQLQEQHFVLSMTAPVRHDPGLGFLSAVCRAVCRRVLDDVHRALYGRRTEEERARSEILKRARNLSVAAALFLLTVLALIESRTIEQEISKGFCDDLRRAEITMADDLLGQVNSLVTEGEKNSRSAARSLRYRILPNLKEEGFALLPEMPGERIISAQAKEARRLYSGTFLTMLPHYAVAARGDCSEAEDLLIGVSMQNLRKFFQELARTSPAQQPKGGTANVLEFAHPDWLTFILIEKFATAAEPSLTFEQLRVFRLLLATYRNSFEGHTLPAAASSGESEPETPLARVGLALVEPAWIVLPLILVLLAGGPVWRVLSSLARAVANWRFVALYREAQQFLELLNYSESLEAKGSLSWKALSLERSRSLAARDLTLPGLTARYVEFVQSVRRHYNGKLIIAIDELDKIHDPEMAKALLAEIKGALFTKGCYYLISISEDARRAFRQRLSSGRDIFESTFDDIIEVPQMSVEAASSMIERRQETSPEAARIPVSCHFVLALAGGGIPREIVRHLRAISLAHENDASTLQPGPVATELFRFEVRDWEAGLAEAELSGEETIKLRAEAKEILALLRDADFGRPACHPVWDHLERCLELIDPAKLRRSVTLFPNIATDDKDTPHAVLRYQAILDDIQSCLRLMILTTVCELAWQEGEAWKEHETALLAAYRALADKPALAETLLGEIRAALGSTACEGETTAG